MIILYRALQEISSLGGNKELEHLIGKLSQLYKTVPSPSVNTNSIQL